MNIRNQLAFSFLSQKKKGSVAKGGKKTLVFEIDKRQKFVIAVLFLSLGLFFSEFHFGKSGFYISIIASFLTDIFLYWSIRNDLKENFSYPVFILPFFYSLAFGLYYFLVPPRLFSRVILTSLYAFGLYSLFLSQNIFTVSSIRTIALLSGARIVSYVITLVSYFFLTNILYTFHLPILPTMIILSGYTYLLIYHSLWTYSLQKSPYPIPLWALGLCICLMEASLILWFWPSSPTVLALFLTGFFYTIVGLTHVWMEKRLFRGALWEYVWVGTIVFFVLLLFSSWGK